MVYPNYYYDGDWQKTVFISNHPGIIYYAAYDADGDLTIESHAHYSTSAFTFQTLTSLYTSHPSTNRVEFYATTDLYSNQSAENNGSNITDEPSTSSVKVFLADTSYILGLCKS